MRTRPARSADAMCIRACLEERLSVHRPLDELAASLELDRTLALLLVDDEDHFLGCALGWSAGPVAELTDIAIDECHCRQGFGQHLLNEFLMAMRHRGVEEVQLEVRAVNGPAIRLYARSGFQQVGKRTGYYADGTDALLYSYFF